MTTTEPMEKRRSENALGILAKYWEPGAVKTRLGATVGPEPAAHLQYLFLRTLIRRLSTINTDRILCYTPAERVNAFRCLLADDGGPGWFLQGQVSGHLGDRMAGWFQYCFRRGYARAVLLGADAPTVPLAVIGQAWDALRQVPVVLGPSLDGGYYLVGATASAPAAWYQMFRDMPWGTPQVWAQTRQRLANHGVPVVELPRWYDVDEWADLRRLSRDLRGDGASAELQAFVRQLRRRP